MGGMDCKCYVVQLTLRRRLDEMGPGRANRAPTRVLKRQGTSVKQPEKTYGEFHAAHIG